MATQKIFSVVCLFLSQVACACNDAPNSAAQAGSGISLVTTVYLPDDSPIADLRPDQKKLRMIVDYLQEHPSATLMLEGHTDDRGTNERNLALGSRYAEGVKKKLVLQGIDASRIQTLSLGEERPAVAGHTKRAWSKNRRVVIRMIQAAMQSRQDGGSELSATHALQTFKDCPDCSEMVVMPAGSFYMGSVTGTDEKPVHRVDIGHHFAIGRTEVTQRQWRSIMGNNPGKFMSCGDDCPVEQVSWNDVQAFIQKLNARTGQHYRLPSEAEWEYACRAGGQHTYCGGNDPDTVAWYGFHATPKGNSRETTYPVATRQANAWGLYDMSGNVREWVEDSYHENYRGAPADGSVWQGTGGERVLRGGSWFYSANLARASVRISFVPELRDIDFGFRLAMTLP